jgi:hypothetical protein
MRRRALLRVAAKSFSSAAALVIVVTTGTGIALHVPCDDTDDEAQAQRLWERPASAILS